MEPTQMPEEDAALMRARLHLRGGKHHLQAGLHAAGLAALYDSLVFGMRYYIAKHERCASLVENVDHWDAVALFHFLARAGLFDDRYAFDRLSRTVECALWQESFSFDAEATCIEVEGLLTKLGVIPFDETGLPRETLLTH
jgi:hypothetical protein